MLKLLYRLGNGMGILSLVVLTFLLFQKEGAETLPPSGETSLSANKGRQNDYSAAAAQLLSNATQIEGFTTNFFNPTFPDFKTSWAGDRSRTKVTEALLNTRFLQYINTSKNLLVNYRKSDLIFPFHYYW